MNQQNQQNQLKEVIAKIALQEEKTSFKESNENYAKLAKLVLIYFIMKDERINYFHARDRAIILKQNNNEIYFNTLKYAHDRIHKLINKRFNNRTFD